ncbi:MAG: hypothetical protein A2583_10650 [Bdellovibrionales bacterium RIFOXYD1_FULL_53_11]|nr:MAG: hypothetical protein A2583_10650 [Bdellovibrionales bacterium RIFOXYD1_FULL_53_11]
MAASKKLLVADDSLTIQKVIRLALSNEGYEIQTVSDGNDAIQQIALFRPDIILIDVSLPGKNAIEVKASIEGQHEFKKIKFILMSSAFEKHDEAGAAKAAFHGKLTKPFDPTHLRQVLSEALGANNESADILEPIKPEDDFSVPPPPAGEPIGNLWDNKENNEFPELSMPPPLEPPRPSEMPDSDIKHLTESTIRMVGLDDFQWKVNDSAKRTEDAMAYHNAPEASPEMSVELPTEPPPLQMPPPPPPVGFGVQPAVPPPSIPVSQIEDIVRIELERKIEEFTRKALPDIAERVIKQEINRLLNLQP